MLLMHHWRIYDDASWLAAYRNGHLRMRHPYDSGPAGGWEAIEGGRHGRVGGLGGWEDGSLGRPERLVRSGYRKFGRPGR